jgi:hypothetical protein
VVNIAVTEHRIVLTRDRRLLFAKNISYGYWVRAVDVESQVVEVLAVLTYTAQFSPLFGAWFATAIWRRSPRRIFWIVLNPKPGFIMRYSIIVSIASVYTGKGRT